MTITRDDLMLRYEVRIAIIRSHANGRLSREAMRAAARRAFEKQLDFALEDITHLKETDG